MTTTSRRNNSRAANFLDNVKDFAPVALAFGVIFFAVFAMLHSSPDARMALVTFFHKR